MTPHDPTLLWPLLAGFLLLVCVTLLGLILLTQIRDNRALTRAIRPDTVTPKPNPLTRFALWLPFLRR